MDLLIILTCVVLAWTVSKIFCIPVSQRALTTTVLGGVLLVGGSILLTNYDYSYTFTV